MVDEVGNRIGLIRARLTSQRDQPWATSGQWCIQSLGGRKTERERGCGTDADWLGEETTETIVADWNIDMTDGDIGWFS